MNGQLKLHMTTIEELVPREHFLRKLDAALDLSFVREETAYLYSKKFGRPAIDPVILVKYLLVGYLYGIPSERQIEERVNDSFSLRWYLGMALDEQAPDHSTISQLRRRKPSFRKIFRRLFEEVVARCVEKGLVSGRVIGVDSTHVKANVSRASEELVELTEEPGVYWERLDVFEEEGLEKLEKVTGKRRKKRTKQIKKERRQTKKRVSRTDPEAGYMNRPGKPKGMHYLSHQAVDCEHGVIVGVAATSGDVNDSAPFLNLVESVQKTVKIQAVTADAAYDFPLAHRVLHDQNISFFVRKQKKFDRSAVAFTREKFAFDEVADAYICPQGKALKLNTLSRTASGLSWQYVADKQDCGACESWSAAILLRSGRKIFPGSKHRNTGPR